MSVTAVVGWVDAYTSPYRQEKLTSDRKKALIERIRKRQYNFNYNDHPFLCFAAPFYNDGTLSILSKSEWDSVINEAYVDMPLPPRLMPQDILTFEKNGVLWEKEKHYSNMVGE